MFETPEEFSQFHGGEFADTAIIRTNAGDVQITGIFDSANISPRPLSPENSTRSAFVTGAAEFSVSQIQCVTSYRFVLLGVVKQDFRVDVTSGNYIGGWRIKEIQRDGDLCRFILNKL